MEAPPREAA